MGNPSNPSTMVNMTEQSNLHCQVGLTGTDPDSQIYRIHANAQ
jgi:hypothetical protein